MSRVPDFLVIGAQKAASTYLQFCLSDHPDIWMPHGETPYLEDPDYQTLELDYLDRDLVGRPEHVLGLKRPQWIGRAGVPARICRDLPDARLIAVLRTPVECAISAYYHYMRGSYLPVLDPEIGPARLLEQDADFHSAWPRTWEVLEFGLYNKHLEGYAPFFARGTMRVILQEDIASDALGTAQSLYAFLCVDAKFMPNRMAKRPQAVVYDLHRLKYLQNVGQLTMRKNADNTRSIGQRNIMARLGYRSWRAVDETLLKRLYPSRRPRLSEDLAKRLVEFYDQDIRQLETTLGRDLSGWRSC